MPFPLSFLGSFSAAVVFVVGSASSVFPVHADDPSPNHIAYPSGYRQWVHIKSGILGPEFQMESERGVHHVYANKTALAGFERGSFEDGSVIVYDLVSLSEKGGGVVTEGARRRIDVMVKDSKLYADSAGWGFGRFMSDDHEHDVLTADIRKTCSQCHQKVQAHDMVYSQFRN